MRFLGSYRIRDFELQPRWIADHMDHADTVRSAYYDFDPEDWNISATAWNRSLVKWATSPWWSFPSPPILISRSGKTQNGRTAPLTEKIRELSGQLGFIYCDLLEEMADRKLDAEDVFFVCDDHWSPTGNRIAADLLETLRGRSLQTRGGQIAVLFNSIQYLFVFLPLVFLGFHLLRLTGSGRIMNGFLALASLVFYGSWAPEYLLLIGFSVCANFLIGRAIPKARTPRPLLLLGFAVNLGLLGYFKYAQFVLDNAMHLFGSAAPALDIILPIGISFFTFQQISFLVDAYRDREMHYAFPDYLLFVTFFPQLIAGPIVHHREMMPQFRELPCRRIDWSGINTGLLLIAIGLNQEGHHRRQARPLGGRRICRRGGAEHLGRMENQPGLHLPALLRLFRVHGHRPGLGQAVRHRPAVELQLALPVHEHPGILAAVAHHPGPVPAQLRLLPPRRQPGRPDPHLRQPCS